MRKDGRGVSWDAVSRKLLSALVLAGLAPAAVAGTRLQISDGVDFSTGKFGATTKTDVFVAPLAFKLKTGHFSVRLLVPYVVLSGPANVSVIVGENDGSSTRETDGVESESGSESSGSGESESENENGSGQGSTTAAASATRTVSGLGDMSLSAIYSFDSIADTPLYVDLIGRVRLPTGNDRNGIGIGATDYTAQTEIGVDADPGGLFIGGGRRFLQNANGIKRRDGWQASGGGWLNVGKRAEIGAYYNWVQSPFVGSVDASDVGVYTVLKVSRDWKVEFGGNTSLYHAGADYGLSLRLIWGAFDSLRR